MQEKQQEQQQPQQKKSKCIKSLQRRLNAPELIVSEIEIGKWKLFYYIGFKSFAHSFDSARLTDSCKSFVFFCLSLSLDI